MVNALKEVMAILLALILIFSLAACGKAFDGIRRNIASNDNTVVK